MIEDVDLLHRFAEEGSEEAFAELVHRRIGLVYSVALRSTHDAQRAEDATQAVFLALARKASTLAQRPVLLGWFYRSARFAASDLVRSELRRQVREEEARNMQLLGGNAWEPDWERLRPVIDEILNDIGSRDRDALLLRFIDGKPFAEIGIKLQLTENAARMRVERALDRMRVRLERQGLKSTAAVLALALEGQVCAAVPAGLAAKAIGMSVGGATYAGGVGTGILTSMSATKITAIIAGAVALAAIGFGVYENGRLRESQSKLVTVEKERGELRNSLQSLRMEVAQQGRPGAQGGITPAQVQSTLSGLAGPGRQMEESGAVNGMISVKELKNSGNGTPSATIESLLWARETGNVAMMGKLIAFSPADSSKAAEVFANLSASDRESYSISSPEEMIAFVLSGLGAKYSAVQQLTLTQQSNDTATVPVVFQEENGSVSTSQFTLLHTNNGWQWIVPGNVIAGAASQLNNGAPGGSQPR